VYEELQRDEGQGATSSDKKRRAGDDGDSDVEEGEIPRAPKKTKWNPFDVGTSEEHLII